MMKLRGRKIIALIVFILYAGKSGLAAEESRRVEEEKRQTLEHTASRQLSIFDDWVMDYGGWEYFRYNQYNNSDHDSNVSDAVTYSHSVDTRLWWRAVYKPKANPNENNHVIYLRFKDLYIQRQGAAPGEKFDNDGPHVDYAYTLLDFAPVKIEVGRKYFFIGKGIAYGDVNDGAQINYTRPGVNLGIFTSQTRPHQANIDQSVPGYAKASNRRFYGAGLGYAPSDKHAFYAYALGQRDFTGEQPDDFIHVYKYQSEYYGIGAKGDLFPKWTYWTELIRETGETRIYTTDQRCRVDAWALDAEIDFRPQTLNRPNLSWEYAYGSGDSDRVSVTDTYNGNRSGRDNNFLYFGYLPTGIAVSPRLSNLHMLRAGLEWQPFFSPAG
ncbi:MAG: alginate export family protein [Candidatus Omnitrophica bacterium]|nr:alginate export family protein [Candidatus Omnitrophota bacterium]